MRLRTVLLAASAAVLAAGLAAPGLASGAFAPTVRFAPGSLKAGANPKVDFRIAQQAGEEPVSKVTFLMPRGFRFPSDAALADGEILGSGQFTTAMAPLCSASMQQSFDSVAKERDRTQEDIQQGVWDVWVVDLGVAHVDLVFTRLPKGDWRAVAVVPTNPLVCPPDVLAASLNRVSSGSHTAIWGNPRKPGVYTIKSILESPAGTKYIVKQRLRFRKKK
jgi:hypothetical protein